MPGCPGLFGLKNLSVSRCIHSLRMSSSSFVNASRVMGPFRSRSHASVKSVIGVTRGVVSLGIIPDLPFWLDWKHAALIYPSFASSKGPIPFRSEPLHHIAK